MAPKIPPGSWDSHMHVVDPTHYPLAPDAQYVPSRHTLSDAIAFEASLGLQNIVLVQPSIYGNDNSCMLDALQKIGPQHGRGVVQFDPFTVERVTLDKWHDMGVRGVRLNLTSTGKEMEISEFEALLKEYARRISPFGWVLELYLSLDMVSSLEKIVPLLGVRVCLDHFANPPLSSSSSISAGYKSSTPVHKWTSPIQQESVSQGHQSAVFDYDPYELPGFSSLISLLRQGSTYVKVSGAYRISSDPELRDLEPLAVELMRVAGKNRLVFATDWPHTRFEGLDIRPLVAKVMEWCKGDEELIEGVFRGTAEDLWDVKKH
ncbi:unnamed protein product [Calypogeia fissa]